MGTQDDNLSAEKALDMMGGMPTRNVSTGRPYGASSDPLEAADHRHMWNGGLIHLDDYGNTVATFTCATCGMNSVRILQNFEVSRTAPIVTAEPDGHYHCWHIETNIQLQTFPPQYPYVCCHCGEKRNFRERDFKSFGYSPHGTKHEPSDSERMRRAFRHIPDPDKY